MDGSDGNGSRADEEGDMWEWSAADSAFGAWRAGMGVGASELINEGDCEKAKFASGTHAGVRPNNRSHSPP